MSLLGVLGFILSANLTPWVEAADVMRTVHSSYARTFGVPSPERIERLPRYHHGAYMALYNVDAFAPAFIPDAKPRPEAIVRFRASYSALDRDIRILPDPVFGAADRLALDRNEAEWLFAPDGSALDTADLEGLEPIRGAPLTHAYRATSRSSWLIVSAEQGRGLEHVAGAEEFAYLTIRPPPGEPPMLFWIDRSGRPFGDPRFLTFRPELAVKDGRVVPRDVGDGFVLYVYPLHEHRHWPGIENIETVRLDPVHAGTFELGFFGIARRKGSGAAEPGVSP